jgi:hypothetical protein
MKKLSPAGDFLKELTPQSKVSETSSRGVREGSDPYIIY